ncbi:hypothetical protein QVD17_05269 [Tagetes erecta]|uniref:Uncharacterized protein n=1 Tax=Tagetes erecta TaxID=13708 RepID=A0AAD8LI83_TARER|nr:hypothetical protein QVD17_05269 [Tagetes erecta]
MRSNISDSIKAKPIAIAIIAPVGSFFEFFLTGGGSNKTKLESEDEKRSVCKELKTPMVVMVVSDLKDDEEEDEGKAAMGKEMVV